MWCRILIIIVVEVPSILKKLAASRQLLKFLHSNALLAFRKVRAGLRTLTQLSIRQRLLQLLELFLR